MLHLFQGQTSTREDLLYLQPDLHYTGILVQKILQTFGHFDSTKARTKLLENTEDRDSRAETCGDLPVRLSMSAVFKKVLRVPDSRKS